MIKKMAILVLGLLPVFSSFSQTDYSIYTEKDWAKRKKIMKLLASPLKAALIVYRWGDLDEWDELGGKNGELSFPAPSPSGYFSSRFTRRFGGNELFQSNADHSLLP